MKGFPKTIKTTQDFTNLLADDRFKEKALAELKRIYNVDDLKATKATTLIDPDDEEKGYNTEEINNPMPEWKLKGFISREAVNEMIQAA